MKIIQDILTVNYSRGRQGQYPADCIVVHVTQGSAESCRSWFKNPASKVSSHYLVTKKGKIYQFVYEYDTAQANGLRDRPTAAVVLERLDANPNWWTISIEHEGSGAEELTTPQRISSLWLIRDITSRRRIPLTRRHILRHQEIRAGKSCPGAIDVDRLVSELNAMQDFSDVTGGSSTTDPTP